MMKRKNTTKTLLLACAAVAAMTSPVIAQNYKTQSDDGVRHLVPKDESKQNAFGNLIQSRAIDMGFFQWPIPSKKVAADPATRPLQVSSCVGHNPDYRPAPEFSSERDLQVRKSGLAKTFLYEWAAYENAITELDCTCNTLMADWPTAVAAFDALTEGVDNPNFFTPTPIMARDAIKRDYDRMCDITMLLELE